MGNTALTALSVVAKSVNPDIVSHRESGLTRSSGSYVLGLHTWDTTYTFLAGLQWEEVPPEGIENPAHSVTYLKAPVPEGAEAFRNVLSVKEARERGLKIEARVHKPSDEGPNPKGYGLFAEGSADLPTQEIWMGVGPFQGVQIPWFWHPGGLANYVTAEHYREIEALMEEGEISEEQWELLDHLVVHLHEGGMLR